LPAVDAQVRLSTAEVPPDVFPVFVRTGGGGKIEADVVVVQRDLFATRR
jgi:hypothetical protein